MSGLDRRLCRLEAVSRLRQPIMLAEERMPTADALAPHEARAAAEGRRLVVVITGVCRAPGDPIGAATA